VAKHFVAPRVGGRRRPSQLGETADPGTRVPKAFLPLAAVNLFVLLRVDCHYVQKDLGTWWPVFAQQQRNYKYFEVFFGKWRERDDYNRRNLHSCEKTRAPVITARGPFHDLVVPVLRDGEVLGYLAAGPVLKEPLTVDEVVRAWRTVSGRTPRTGDPDLVAFTRSVLDTPVLGAQGLTAFRRLLQYFSDLLADAGRAPGALSKMQATYTKALGARTHQESADMAGMLVDRWDSAEWRAQHNWPVMRELGFTQFPNAVIAAMPRRRERETSFIESAVLGRALQIACVRFCHGRKGVISGRLSDEGVFLVVSTPESNERRGRAWLTHLTQALREFARRELELELSVGVSRVAPGGERLPNAYQEALLALGWGVNEGRPLTHVADIRSARGQADESALLHRREELKAAFGSGDSARVALALDRVMLEFAHEAQQSADATRAFVLATYLDLVELAQRHAVFDARALNEEIARFRQELLTSLSAFELPQVFKDAVMRLIKAYNTPAAASLDAKIERALALLEHRTGEPLELSEVAKHVGLGQSYLSRVFKQRTGEGFSEHRARVRLAHAAELLRTTSLPVGDVGLEAGFGSPQSFFLAFKRAYRETPRRYRLRIEQEKK
jgi:AraC-like DNA-binding protein